jgi:amino acid transporter
VSDPGARLPGELGIDDARLDATRTADEAYLAQLGYKQELRRALGLFGAFAIQFSLIGVSLGLFLLFGYGLTTGGPAFILPFIVGGGLQMLVGLSIAELVSAYPLAGGSYQIISRLGSKLLAWQVGWWLVIALLAAVAAEAIGVAIYISPWFGVQTPDATQSVVIGFAVIVLITLINVVGIRIASFINNIGVLAELLGLSTIVVLLLIKGLIQPISFLGNTGGTDSGGNYLLPFAFVMLMPAFIIASFDSTGHTGEETKNAAVDAPKGVLIANFGAYIYAVIAIAILLLSIPNLGAAMKDSAPIVYIVTTRLGKVFSDSLTAVVVVSFIVNMQILELTAGRIFYAQARDGQLPFAGLLRKVSANQSPMNATIVAAVICVAFTLYSNLLNVLAAVTSIAFAASYGATVLVGMSAKRRGTLPHHPWSYGRWGTLIDVVSVIWCVVLCVIFIYQSPSTVGVAAIIVAVAGLVIYYVGIPRSRRGIRIAEEASAAPRV